MLYQILSQILSHDIPMMSPFLLVVLTQLNQYTLWEADKIRENRHVSWVNQLYMALFSSYVMLVYQRVSPTALSMKSPWSHPLFFFRWAKLRKCCCCPKRESCTQQKNLKLGDSTVPLVNCHMSSVQNLCWLMIMAYFTTSYFGDYNEPIEVSL